MPDEPSVLERHGRAVAGFDAVVDHAAAADAWTRPSPCEGWTAADIVMHVTGVHHRVASQLGESCEMPKSTEADELTGGWRGVRDTTLHALSQPGALDVEIKMGAGTMTAGQFVNILMTDTLLHTWDLARAVGADERLDPELVERAHRAAIPLEETIRTSGAFGPRVDIADDADPQAQMLAFFGRDPR